MADRFVFSTFGLILVIGCAVVSGVNVPSDGLALIQVRASIVRGEGNDDSAPEQVVEFEMNSTAACGRHVSSNERLLLLGLAPPYHGSTALLSLFMSSNQVSTLCESGASQCEGGKLLKHLGYSQDVGKGSSDSVRILKEYAPYWKRPILFDKTPNMYEHVERIHSGLADSGQRLAYVLMWRPTCLWTLSSHEREHVEETGKEQMAGIELKQYQRLVKAHKYLLESEAPVIVVSLADLMWSNKQTVSRLEKFVPCAGKLDGEFVPKPGRDVVEKNRFKAHGSIAAFGKSSKPGPVGYNVASGQCSESSNLFNDLPTKMRDEALGLEAYLLKHSRS